MPRHVLGHVRALEERLLRGLREVDADDLRQDPGHDLPPRARRCAEELVDFAMQDAVSSCPGKP